MKRQKIDDEKEDLLRWLQERRAELRLTLEKKEVPELKGQLSAYTNTIAFIMSGGKLR